MSTGRIESLFFFRKHVCLQKLNEMEDFQRNGLDLCKGIMEFQCPFFIKILLLIKCFWIPFHIFRFEELEWAWNLHSKFLLPCWNDYFTNASQNSIYSFHSHIQSFHINYFQIIIFNIYYKCKISNNEIITQFPKSDTNYTFTSGYCVDFVSTYVCTSLNRNLF